MLNAPRKRNTNRNGGGFPPAVIQAVWQKGRVDPNNDPAIWRKDVVQSFLDRREYGNTESQYGWEIDHIVPVSRGGTDDLSNLQPLQWENNRRKGDAYPWPQSA